MADTSTSANVAAAPRPIQCARCTEWQLVERFDGRGGQNVIFHCHFCGHHWHATVDNLRQGSLGHVEMFVTPRVLVEVDPSFVQTVREACDSRYCDGRCDDMGCRGHEPEDGLYSERDLALGALGKHVFMKIEEKKPT